MAANVDHVYAVTAFEISQLHKLVDDNKDIKDQFKNFPPLLHKHAVSSM